MDARTESGQTAGDAVTEIASLLAGLGMIVMVVFPFALPALFLCAVILVPLLPVVVLAALVVPPILAVRWLRRQVRTRRRPIDEPAGRPIPAAAARIGRPAQ